MKQTVKKFFTAIILAVCLIPLAFSANIIRLDQSQLNNTPPDAVQSGYKPYCTASGIVAGYYIGASIASITYSGTAISSMVESDAVSGVVGSHNFTTNYTYSNGNLISTSCPTLTQSF